jgi:hypothetical protein
MAPMAKFAKVWPFPYIFTNRFCNLLRTPVFTAMWSQRGRSHSVCLHFLMFGIQIAVRAGSTLVPVFTAI